MTVATDMDPENRRLALTEASRANLIAAGVKGRFRAQGTAMAPGLVSEALPTSSREKSTAIPSINAVEVTEPEEVA